MNCVHCGAQIQNTRYRVGEKRACSVKCAVLAGMIARPESKPQRVRPSGALGLRKGPKQWREANGK